MPVQSSIRWTGARRLPLAAAVLLVFGTNAHAATIVVTQDTDAHLAGLCSLREAIQSANEHSAPAETNCLAGSGADDTIQIPFASISLSQGTLAPTGTLLIEGTVEGSRTTVMRPADAPAFPIFSVMSGDLTVQRLQISGGRADFDGYGGGGGINANATVTLVDSVVSGNSSATRGGGGGIYSFRELTLIESTVSGNTAESLTSSGGGIVAKYNTSVIDSTISGNFARYSGGGIAISTLFTTASNYTLSITNSTIADNTAGDGPGGGVFVNVGFIASIGNSTVAFNKSNEASTGKGAGIFINGNADGDGQLILISTLMSGNIRGKYSQDISAARPVSISGNHDLVRDVTPEVTLPADTLHCDPQISDLADNGGPTQTIRLAPESCAIDGGARNNLQYDQRGVGFPRVIGANADIGAIEFQVAAPATYTIGGSIAGLAGSGLVLQQSGGDNLPITTSGSFTFTTPIDDGTQYNVTVLVQPTSPNQTCAIANGEGAVSGSNVTDIAVTCATTEYTVGGTVSGLVGSGLVLQQNGGDDLPITADGSFTFPTPLADGSAFMANVSAQPSNPAQICVVANGSGTVAGANFTDVAVTCSTDITDRIFANGFEVD